MLSDSEYVYVLGNPHVRHLHLAANDVAALANGKKWVRADSYVRVPATQVLWRIPKDGSPAEPIALLNPKTPVAEVLPSIRESYVKFIPDLLVRVSDIVTQKDIARRLGRAPSAIHRATKHQTFPRPVRTIGTYEVWNWPEVEQWWSRYRKGGEPDASAKRSNGDNEGS